MKVSNHIAFDLGASSGRLILGRYKNKKVELEEIYRFVNTPVEMNGVLYWDFPKLFQEMKYGMKILANKKININSLSVDTWGVDYGYIDKNGDLISLPKNYRNPVKKQFEEKIYKIISRENLFKETGIYPNIINSIVQIYTDLQLSPWLKDCVEHVLFMPDLFNYFLSKEVSHTYSIVSTSGLLNTNKQWSKKVIKLLGIPSKWFDSKILNYKVLGKLNSPELNYDEYKDTKIIACAGHDTACGLLTIEQNAAFLSCGTWSILGMKIDKPNITKLAYELGMTNEGTVDGKIKILKNINGLWILQELVRYWAEKGTMYSYSQLTSLAQNSDFNEIIDVDDELFIGKSNMYESIKKYFNDKHIKPPTEVGDFVKTVVLSLANKYSNIIKKLESISGSKIETIHMVGGGIQNELLCELTASETGKTIIAGPLEASAFGNILSQLIALKIIQIRDIEEIIKNSVDIKIYDNKK
ncbi:rhamnulokinase [Staphylococcus hominis]|uniref:rhamnulokinase n=1 Tax=Staphylococcus hominis TaxID=1290 RepID=UPI000D1F68ED|nr:rhamnulokinase family protein [Staphylococcus hominis]PTK39450.1 rhamnulokinase [Staphylococcus hominis]RIO50835.1 rhamnulokinase [Staphylococcus hominis]